MSEQLLREILGELRALNQRVSGLEDGQRELAKRVSGLEERLGSVEVRLGSLEGRLGLVEERLGSLEERQLRLEARLETEVIDKLRALFDGFALRGEQIEQLQKYVEERFDSIETDTRYLVARVVRLEKLAK